MARSDAPVDMDLVADLPGSSQGVVELRRLVTLHRDGEHPVLLRAHDGAEAESVARLIHSGSARAAAPFVPFNCGIVPADLIESELFGHEKGAFRGALSAKAGRFELARNGTIFLENVGMLPAGAQAKLSRVLRSGSYERLGGVDDLRNEARIIAASGSDLQAAVADGTFRADLLSTLDVFELSLPRLNERLEDIPEVVSRIALDVRRQQKRDVRLTQDALHRLREHPWPGDVAELRRLIERFCIEFPGELISTKELPKKYQGCVTSAPPPAANGSTQPLDTNVHLLPVNGVDLKKHLADLECSLIEQALRDSNRVVARAADRLHMRRTTLVEKMRKYGIARGS